MGYVTHFEITIEATTLNRKIELAHSILWAARLGPPPPEPYVLNSALDDFKTSGKLSFDTKWDEWVRDIMVISLNNGESLSIHGVGDGDTDVWRATVTPDRLLYERAKSISYEQVTD